MTDTYFPVSVTTREVGVLSEAGAAMQQNCRPQTAASSQQKTEADSK